ncbi:hypothetical protein [Swingsia samuiensis]|uniref:Uncharacterized protein n=1 Tax=Swingsia samuiensis TaxID=1293412 RepID=A0A4Y6UL82_9PROT|nr:hypothetical protein [Swingsia samuiensis]QDH16795.1 hypothetical protein E3D00_03835 [Swingsia samuiensis]
MMVQEIMVEGAIYPTPERYQHSDFKTVNGVIRIVNTVQSMYDSGDIGDDEVNAADRWYREYLFATAGIVEQRPSDGRFKEKGDIHTWMLGRGKSSVRISDIREQFGLCTHVRLEMMLAREMSFSAMARYLYPAISAGRGRMKVSAQSALILEQLASFYKKQTKK